MNGTEPSIDQATHRRRSFGIAAVEVAALVGLFFIYAGDPAPAVNESHYLVKAKNFWDPSFCSGDLFVRSGKAHTVFYWTFGWLTQFYSLGATAWIGRIVGWLMLAIGLQRCCLHLALPAFACLGTAILWMVGIEHGNLAGEWVVGGIEAKVPAYGMVLLGLSEVIRRRWSQSWIWFGGASAFHVLTGGWAVIAATIAFLVTELWYRPIAQSPPRFFSIGLLIGGGLSLFGLLPALGLMMGVSAEDSTHAARIYSYVRLRHHLLPSDFPWHWFARHGVLVTVLLVLAWKGRFPATDRRLIWIGMGALVIAGCGLVVGLLPAVMPDLAAKLLRYYWFRFSDAIIPLVVALMIMRVISEPVHEQVAPALKRVALASLGIAIGLFLWSAQEGIRIGVPPSTSHRLLGIDLDADDQAQRQSHSDWVAVCDWARLATPTEEIFLTPRHQQTFKWYSGRAEVVNWKDVPQDAGSLLAWLNRFEDVYPRSLGVVPLQSMRVPIGYTKLRSYRQNYGVRFMIVDNRVATKHLPLVKVYPIGSQTNETYSVYELPYD